MPKVPTIQVPLFSQRETQIIRMICRQFSNKEMAEKLGLSIRTIEGHRELILKKMNMKNTAGIVVYAIKNKIYRLH